MALLFRTYVQWILLSIIEPTSYQLLLATVMVVREPPGLLARDSQLCRKGDEVEN